MKMIAKVAVINDGATELSCPGRGLSGSASRFSTEGTTSKGSPCAEVHEENAAPRRTQARKGGLRFMSCDGMNSVTSEPSSSQRFIMFDCGGQGLAGRRRRSFLAYLKLSLFAFSIISLLYFSYVSCSIYLTLSYFHSFSLFLQLRRHLLARQ